MKKVKGDMLREFEAKQTAQNNGEIWVSFVDFKDKNNSIECVSDTEYIEDDKHIELKAFTGSNFQLTGMPRNLCFERDSEKSLSLHEIIECKLKDKDDAVNDLMKIAEEAIQQKDSECSELAGDSAICCEKVKQDWQRRLNFVKEMLN